MKTHSLTRKHLPTIVKGMKILPKPQGAVIWSENDIGVCSIYSASEFLEANVVFSSASDSSVFSLPPLPDPQLVLKPP